MLPIGDYIRGGTKWSQLPSIVQASLNQDAAEYDAHVLIYFLQNQLEYSSDLIKDIVRSEKAYYRQLIQYSSQQMMLFPYHLQKKIVPGLNITPFEYYRNIVRRTMLSELSYDRIPNFTAADCYQILGIGRNEYIDLLNVLKGVLCSAQSQLKEPSIILDGLLPKAPLNLKHLQPWFIVRAGSISVTDVQEQTPEVQAILDKIIDNDRSADAGQIGPGLRISEIPLDIFQELYRRGLVYVDVPVLETDCLCVPTLDGFIMNRVTGDSCETLLYKIFVSLDPQSCLQQLASDLEVGLEFVINAASVFIRLGFAYKSSSSCEPNDEQDQDSFSALTNFSLSPLPEAKKIAFIFDSTITAYLMLGNLSADLKKHSVTMFEVGKLTGDSLTTFYKEISSLSHSAEQDVGVYYEHAKCLSQTMRYLSNAQTSSETNLRCLDLVRCGSLASLEPLTRCRVLSRNYNFLVCMAPLSYEEAQIFGPEWPLILGPPIPEVCSSWFRLFICHTVGEGGMPALLLTRGARITQLPPALARFSTFLVTSWGHDTLLMDIYSLFYSANDLTINSPIFVQAYDDREHNLPLHQHFLPLPLTPEFLDRMCHRLPWLERLSKVMELSCLVGYLSLLLPDGKSDVDSEPKYEDCDPNGEIFGGGSLYQQNTSQFLEHSVIDPRVVFSEAGFEAVINACRPVKLLSVNLGIPLFNSALNTAVFERLRKLAEGDDQLLPLKLRSRLAEANKTLAHNLVTFIKSAGGVYVHDAFSMMQEDGLTRGGNCDKSTSSSALPLPSKSIYCNLTCGLQEWDN
ncbi:hypothetical protein Aperf_G00000024844 [Anoplocephala perfoliata]